MTLGAVLRAVVIAALVLVPGTPPVSAAVVEVATTGFTIRNMVTIPASRIRVFTAFVRDVGRWWDRPHTWSGDAANLSIDGKPGGCFCERLPGGGSVEHMRVLALDPPRLLRMSGALGPLQELAVTGTLTVTFEEDAGRTRVTHLYTVGGPRPGGLEGLATPVDHVMTSQLQRLERYVDRGRPD